MLSYVVTGASRGLGLALVKYLASIESNAVIGLVRNKSATEEQLAEDGFNNIKVVSADITDAKALASAANEVATITGGSLDVLINNAAVLAPRSAFLDVTQQTPDELQEDVMMTFQANVVGVAHTINAFLPLIRKGQLKKVVTLSSGMADINLINDYNIAVAGPYSVSKAATNALIAKYHAALGKKEGICFFCLSPGYVQTSAEQPTTEREIAGLQSMVQAFMKYAPHFKGPMSAEDSVKAQMNVIKHATVETMGGSFVSHLGNKQWL
ncbi:hypothetical protein KC340_g12321 [Hortaea werneckii]|nr:hypothetical protein KC342_g11536 [Hortaea werneckii]KAI7098985.1 hypothetical protein KC339_g8563 [Hortaea werneckii]KAI7225916.1 hypothetical protein KC365_g9699 [Hortaea werneckii]KAI7304125.1 hypothetical protein KC340_g12321 [Hortaea werneckii]KAI7392063.1 hypothetical protein KC328_g7212 [Hortaea werneckii]